MATDGADRRTFFLEVMYGLWAVIAAALAIPAAIYLLFPPRLRKDNEWAEAGDVAKMVPNSPVEMVFRHNRIAMSKHCQRSERNIGGVADGCGRYVEARRKGWSRSVSGIFLNPEPRMGFTLCNRRPRVGIRIERCVRLSWDRREGSSGR